MPFINLLVIFPAIICPSSSLVFQLSEQTTEHDDDLSKQISEKEWMVSKLLILTSLNTILTFVWATLAVGLASQGNTDPVAYHLVNIVLSFLLILITSMQFKKIMHQFNLLYPNKPINLDEKNGDRAYFEKLDEGEKWMVYKAAFKAFQSLDILFVIGIIVLLGYSMLVQFTPLPTLVLTLIWLGVKIIYFVETYKFYGKFTR
ncbi:DUF3169 family protein [Bacillus horti]|uniref:DUF3169 family protein n=1 Tax=Caldalkalibacillus horti TaxID=77523 RepID=A0ABT9VXC2_9BACI|nr:DUF3169 family protein [Bacillus horti]MDQ0165640.1 hypothetical protein [Bacillus horti]